jgi:hypothetical protein
MVEICDQDCEYCKTANKNAPLDTCIPSSSSYSVYKCDDDPFIFRRVARKSRRYARYGKYLCPLRRIPALDTMP